MLIKITVNILITYLIDKHTTTLYYKIICFSRKKMETAERTYPVLPQIGK